MDASPGAPETLIAMLVRNAERFAGRAVFAERQGEELRETTWGTFLDHVVALGRFLSSVGVAPSDRVLVFSPNRGEMLVTEMATAAIGAIYVPIFSGYPADQARALITHARPTVIVVPDVGALERACLPRTVRALLTFDSIDRPVLEHTLVELLASNDLALADRSGASLGQANHVEQLLGSLRALLGGQMKQIAEEIQGLAGIEIAIEVGFLGEIADARLRGDVAG